MKVEALKREFRYNGGVRLPDPNPKLTVGEVINHTPPYPEITTAAIEGPEVIVSHGRDERGCGRYTSLPENDSPGLLNGR